LLFGSKIMKNLQDLNPPALLIDSIVHHIGR
jgi:hypothetical protein